MEQIITLLFLSIFPFGQIIRVGIFQPIDLIVFCGAFWAILKKYKKPTWFKCFDRLLFFALISWIFSLFYFRDIGVFYGLLYLVRLFSYLYFTLFIFNFSKFKKNINLLTNSLISISLISSLFGWIQFFKFPDVKPFFVFGWDEHLYRLVGTFLDPTFLGLIIVFGALISIYKKKYLAFIFLAFSLMFTYSRASYLSLFIGIFYLAIIQKNIRKYLLFIPIFLFVVLLIPTTKNHSINFFRSFSAIAKVGNYQRTIEVFNLSPVFGIGYNNLCFVKNKFFEVESYQSHACSGSDSSLLFILSTTGVIGLIILLEFLINLWKCSDLLFRSILISTLVHSLFSNSLFYSWVLSYLLIMFVVGLRREVNS